MTKTFDPIEHPRDPFGRFLAVVRGLKLGETHTIKTPDGHADISVSRMANGGKGEFHVREGSKVQRHAQSAAATRHVLSISAKQEHGKALGGDTQYRDLAHYQDVNGPGSDPSAKTRVRSAKKPRAVRAGKPLARKEPAREPGEGLERAQGMQLKNQRGYGRDFYADIEINGRSAGYIMGTIIGRADGREEYYYHAKVRGQQIGGHTLAKVKDKIDKAFGHEYQDGAPKLNLMTLEDLKRDRIRAKAKGLPVDGHDEELARRRQAMGQPKGK